MDCLSLVGRICSSFGADWKVVIEMDICCRGRVMLFLDDCPLRRFAFHE